MKTVHDTIATEIYRTEDKQTLTLLFKALASALMSAGYNGNFCRLIHRGKFYPSPFRSCTYVFPITRNFNKGKYLAGIRSANFCTMSNYTTIEIELFERKWK